MIEEISQVVLRVMGEVAPEVDLTQIKPDENFRDQMDIDSVDFLNFVVGLHKEFGVEVPEADYPKLATLNDCVAYLTASPQRRSRT